MLDGNLIVAQLHDVIKISGLRIHPDMEHVHESFVGSGDRFEAADAGQFPLERTLVSEGFAINNLYRPVNSHHVAGQPNFPIAAAANAAQQLVIWNGHPLAILPACSFSGTAQI